MRLEPARLVDSSTCRSSGAPGRAPCVFVLDQNAEVVMHRGCLVGNALSTSLAEIKGAADPLPSVLARLDKVSEDFEPWAKLLSTRSLDRVSTGRTHSPLKRLP